MGGRIRSSQAVLLNVETDGPQGGDCQQDQQTHTERG